MYWNASRDNGTTNPPPECKLPESYPFGSLEEQRSDDLSIYNYYRRAVAIRQAMPVISHGRTTAEKPLNKGCVSAFRKTWGEEECIILMNISDTAAEVDLGTYVDEAWILAASLSVGEETVRFLEDGYLLIPGYGAAVLRPA
jgi:glycosidase